MKHVHIVGISPRSGTTLMVELMTTCFEFDGWPEHEQSLLLSPGEEFDRYCSKNPETDDVRFAPAALRRNPSLWIIGMVRDPRDIVVSRHMYNPDMFWSDLAVLDNRMKWFRRARAQERFLLVRYEELVERPNEVQDRLARTIPFLVKRADFSKFSKLAKPSEKAQRALGGVRPISGGSIGRWRNELPRLKGQIERYGPIEGLLDELGYDLGDDWNRTFDGVEADRTAGQFESKRQRKDRKTRRKRARRLLYRQYLRIRFLAGFPCKADAVPKTPPAG